MSFCMRKLLVVSFFVWLTGPCWAGESNFQGRYLPDGRWQPRNSAKSESVNFLQYQKIENIYTDWSLDQRIAVLDLGCLSYFEPKLATSDGILLNVLYWDAGCGFRLHLVQSIDAGLTWGEPEEFIPEEAHAAYSITAAVANNVIFYAYRMAYNLIGINLRRSIDGGLSWLPNQFIDADFYQGSSGPSLVADENLAYITFSHARVRMGKLSTDYGATWSDNIFISDSSGVGVPDRLALNNSGLHLVRSYGSSPYFEVNYKRSTDWGQTWSDDRMLSTLNIWQSFWPRICAWGDSGVAVAWCDYMYSPYDFTGDIIVRVSSDNGNTWGPEIVLTEDHLAKDCDIEARGDSISIVYTEGAWDENSELYIRQSMDAGLTWGEATQLTYAVNFSEDADLIISGDKLLLSWADSRDDTVSGGYYRDIYFKRGDLASSIREPEGCLPKDISLLAYPNPFNSATTITLTGGEQAEIAIYDITGSLITTLHTIGGQALWDASANSSGLYFARVAGEKASTVKLVLVK